MIILVNTTRNASLSPKLKRMIKVITLARPSLTPGTIKINDEIADSTMDKTTEIEIIIAINTSFLTFNL
jgi:hypothetical protein